MKNQIKKTLALLLVILIQASFIPKLAAKDKGVALISDIVEHHLKQQKLVGVSIVLVENSKLSHLSFGKLSKGKSQLITPNSIFEIGSISKTFTAAALASMVKHGKVSLNDPVQKYLPKTVQLPNWKGQPITLESLSNHTSGLPRLPDNLPLSDPTDPYADYTIDLMYAFLSSFELKRDIGVQVEYSNLGTGLLGHVLALIDKKTFEDMIIDRILHPLGMNNTSVSIVDTEKFPLSDGHNQLLSKVKYWNLETLAGAGAIKSNGNDMGKYLKAQIENEPLNDILALTHEQTTPSQPNRLKLGLGWFIDESNNENVLWHNGQTGGFSSFIGFNKAEKRGIVILTNSINSLDKLGMAYLKGTLTQLYDDTVNTLILEQTTLDNLTGKYVLSPEFIISVTNQDKQLFIQATGQPRFPFVAKSNSEFVNLDLNARIVFEQNKKGDVIALALKQNGNDLRARRQTEGEKIAVQQPKSLSEKQLNNLVGKFEITPNFAIETSHDSNSLYIQATGQQKFKMETLSEESFFNAQVQAKIVFELDSKGEAIALTLFQSGQEIKGRRKLE